MKFLREKDYNELLIKNKQRLLLKAKLDKINILVEKYKHGENVFTVMRDISNLTKEV